METGYCCCFFFNDTATTEIYTLSLHDALPISPLAVLSREVCRPVLKAAHRGRDGEDGQLLAHLGRRSEEHTSELQSRQYLVCRLLLEKKISAIHHEPIIISSILTQKYLLAEPV